MRRDAASLVLLAAAALSILLAALGFGRGIEGYSQASHSLSLLGNDAAPAAGIANALLFVLPGLLVMAVAWRLRGRLAADSGWRFRLALQLGLLAALSFALQGVFNLDPRLLPDEGPNRLHAAAWAGWWLVSALSMLLLAVARGVPFSIRWLSLACAIAVPVLLMAMPVLGAAGFAQRLAIAIWLGWWWLLAVAFNRSAADGSPA